MVTHRNVETRKAELNLPCLSIFPFYIPSKVPFYGKAQGGYAFFTSDEKGHPIARQKDQNTIWSRRPFTSPMQADFGSLRLSLPNRCPTLKRRSRRAHHPLRMRPARVGFHRTPEPSGSGGDPIPHPAWSRSRPILQHICARLDPQTNRLRCRCRADPCRPVPCTRSRRYESRSP